ncbi:MAG: hypothetical protein EPN25_01870 [Nitrospirae bacterium]|nr:MAG: hypothetical protein EPN25_01870 [Nitrospirota bacterium]
MIKRSLVIIAVVLCATFFAVNYAVSVGPGNLTAATGGPNKHNLSVSGPGPHKALGETQICIFCHTPHKATVSIPLWNHTLSAATYTLPSSATQKSVPSNPPDGSSRLCLSCHDGTVPLGSVQNFGGPPTIIPMGGGALTGPSNMGTNISGHHLVSIELPATLNAAKAAECQSLTIAWNVRIPSNITASWTPLQPTNNSFGGSLTKKGVQCTSCHDPHMDNPVGGAFIKAASRGSWTTRGYTAALCLACHCQCPGGGLNCQ